GIEFRILDVEHSDKFVIDVGILEVIEVLQYEVTGVRGYVGARVVTRRRIKAFEGYAVVNVFSGGNLIGVIDSGFVERVEDRKPALGQFFKSLVDQTCRPLWPRIDGVPHQRA